LALERGQIPEGESTRERRDGAAPGVSGAVGALRPAGVGDVPLSVQAGHTVTGNVQQPYAWQAGSRQTPSASSCIKGWIKGLNRCERPV